MNAQTTLIMLIVTLIITAGGVYVIHEYSSSLGSAASLNMNKQHASSSTGKSELSVVTAVGTQVGNGGYQYMHFQVTYDGTGNLSLNDTYIQISTDKSTADLTYRNGTLTRDINTGFYTQ